MNAAKLAEKKARNASRISIGKAMTIGHHLAMTVHATIDREMIAHAMIEAALARRAPAASIAGPVVEVEVAARDDRKRREPTLPNQRRIAVCFGGSELVFETTFALPSI